MVFYYQLCLIGFTLLLLSQNLDALECYQCAGCNDPFNSNGVNINVNTTAGIYCRKRSVLGYIYRDSSISCNAVNVINNGEWCCQSDRCNSGHQLASTGSFVIASAIMLFRFIF